MVDEFVLCSLLVRKKNHIALHYVLKFNFVTKHRLNLRQRREHNRSIRRV